MTRKRPDGDPRQVIAVRTRTDLKQRLERIAEENGHSLGQEAELRLEASLSDAPGSKLERFIKNRPGLVYLIDMVTPLELTNQLGETLLGVARHADDVSWSEKETREAMASAFATVTYYYFWRGDDVDGEAGTMPAAPVPDVQPIPSPDTKYGDLPPKLMGYLIAENTLLYRSALQDQPTHRNTCEGLIANVWSGDGKQVEQVLPKAPERKLTAKRRARLDVAPGGLIGEEETARLHAEGKIRRADPHWYQVLVAREAERAALK